MKTKESQLILLFFLIIIWVSVSFFYLLFSYYTWPPYDGDSVFYLPPAIQYAKDHTLLNKALLTEMFPYLVGQGRLVYHGFLYQMLIGSLAFQPTYPCAITIIAILKVIILACFIFLLYKILSLAHFGTFWKLSFIGTASLGISTFLHGLLGRPEPIAILFLTLLVIFIMHINIRWHWVLFGLAIAGLICSHPIGALLLSILFISYCATKFSLRQTIVYFFFTLCLTSLVSGFLFMWYPYTLWEWLGGIYYHFSKHVFFQPRFAIVENWFLSPSCSAYGVVFILAMLALMYLYSQFTKQIKIKWLFSCSVFLFLISAYYFAIYVSFRNYNLLMFSPLAYAVIVYAMSVWENSLRRRKSKSFALVLRILIASVFFLSSFGFLRDIFLFFDHKKNGISYEKAKYMLSEFRNKNKGKLLISSGLFTLTEDYTNMIVAQPYSEILDKFQPEHIFLQQVYKGKRLPPEIPGYKLISNYYSQVVPKFLGARIANVTKAYNFAIYKRKSQK
jgi:hypothetical protein